MGRPSRQVVEYFPHDCIHKKTMDIVEGRFGNNGYAVWFKLLELLGATEGHAVDFSDEIVLEHFSAVKCHVSAPETLQILGFLSRLSAIDSELWDRDRVVWCQHFVDRLEEVYRKRKCSLPEKPHFRDGNPVSAPDIPGNEGFRCQESTKESKVKERKGKNKEEQTCVLPDWLPLETWNDFLEMRKSIKHPATPKAQELIISDLIKFKTEGYDPVSILNKSIKNSWRDVFEPKDGGKANGKRKDDPGHVNVFHTARLSDPGHSG